MAETILIKKYANRRLYDTRRSHYITVSELSEIVRGGGKVKVVDAKSNADLTRQVLLQVLLEDQERLDLLPVELLHHIVRVQGTLQAAPFARWLADSFAQWETVGEVVSSGLSGAGNPATAWMDAMRKATGWGGPQASPATSAGTSSTANPGSSEPAGQADREPEDTVKPDPAHDPLAGLRAQMDDLLGKLGG